MSVTGNIISSPVSIADLRTLLGAGSGDLGYNVRNGNIRTWAKYKPFRSTSLTVLPDTQRGGSPYYFGLSFPQFNSPTAANASGLKLYTPYDNDSSIARYALNGWEYLRPRGRGSAGGDEWYRLLDFAGYDHGATEPLILMGGNIEASTALSTAVTIGAIRKDSFATGEIDLATMPDVRDMYFSLVGYRLIGGDIPSSPDIFVVSAASPVSSGLLAATINFTGANFPAARLGTWAIYPCLCSVGNINYYQASGQSLPSATYIPLPCCKRWTADVASNQRTASLYGQKVSNDHTTAWYRLRINNTATAYTFTGVRVWFLHSYHTPSDTLLADEKYLDFGDITVAANGTYDTGSTYLQTTIQSSLWADLTLYATCSAGFDRVGPVMPLTPSS